nr:uncharacterized protein LOC112544076 [Pelodiscus sinensis]|eukprot:XP_025035409.1 uncharacterized protein LOC112544076 [Pelodiscus sinensis]
MAFSWFQNEELTHYERVKQLILNSQRSSMRYTYQNKWRQFQEWCGQCQLRPNTVLISTILEFLMDLHDAGLSIISIHVHVSAITDFHKSVDNVSLFTHPITKHFLVDLQKTCPNSCSSVPLLDLNLMLGTITRPPSEPLATASLQYLAMKVAFIVAITSARKGNSHLHTKLIASCIYTSYWLHRREPSQTISAHSIHAMVTATALL